MNVNLLKQAMVDHQAGRWEQAEAGYRQLLQINARHPDANHNLAVLLRQTHRLAAALPLFKTALEVCPNHAQFWISYLEALIDAGQVAAAQAVLELGQVEGLADEVMNAIRMRFPALIEAEYQAERQRLLALFEARKYEEAAQLARHLTQRHPNDGFAWKALGVMLQQSGHGEAALEATQRAVDLSPSDVDAQCNLASMLKNRGRFTEAEAIYRQVLTLQPDHVEGLFNLGNLLSALAREHEAVLCYKQVVLLQPGHVKAWINLGNVLLAQKHAFDAENCYRQVWKIDKNHKHVLHNLGAALHAQAKYQDAEKYYRQAIVQQPSHADFHNDLGNVLRDQQRLPEAMASYLEALSLNPNHVGALNNIANILKDQFALTQAEAYYRKALELAPDNACAYGNLGVVLKDQGRLSEAELSLRQAMSLKRNDLAMASNFLLMTMYSNKVTPSASFAEHLLYGKKVSKLVSQVDGYVPPIVPLMRPLRIGWISADLRQHAVAYFLLPLFLYLRAEGFSLFAYSNSPRQDQVTDTLRYTFDGWSDVFGLNDDALASRIAEDRIDILIDLSGHTAGNRLPVFACKPAPVQVTWLGYPATTGVPGMDWRITDVHAEPEGLTEHLNTEKLWRLPEIFCCYQPSPNSPEPLSGLPCETLSPADRVQGLPPELDQAVDPAAQVITLGCFNNFAKVTPPVIALWSQILSRLPQARLLLEIHGGQDPQFTADVRQRFVQAGARPEQVHIVPRKPEHQYALYRQLDLALDPFPCTGGTTSCDSLWMGVPFVTLAGEWFVGRMGVTLLHNAGLDELIAHSPAEYADKVVALVKDLPRLRAIRHGLRERVAASPIMDSARFGQHFAQALRGMWAASSEQTSSAPPL